MNKNLLTSIIFATGAFLFFALVLPRFDNVKNSSQILSTKQSFLTEARGNLNNFKQLQADFESKQGDTNKILISLPRNKQIDQIISSIQVAASQNGVLLRGLTTGEVNDSTAGDLKKISINLDMQGNYQSFINFLAVIESNLRVYDVFSLSMGKDTSGSALIGLLNINMKMNAFNL